MDDLRAATIYRATAGYLRKHGWIQHCFWNGGEDRERCLAGAICAVTGIHVLQFGAGRDLVLVDALGFAHNVALFNWNDEPGRTVDEVLDRLESTALALEVRALASEAAFNESVNVPVSVNVAEPVGV